MKKKILLGVLAVLLLLAVLFVPIPMGSYDDGGSSVYLSLTYKIVNWKRLTYDGLYENTRVYFGKDRSKSITELWELESENVVNRFVGTVLEINGDLVIVEPVENEPERYSSDRISFSKSMLSDIGAKVGSIVDVSYKGGIMESYPAQVNAVDWSLSNTLRHLEFNGEWIDKGSAEKYDNNIFSDIIITKIYSNCFFARTVIPMPYEIKLNGTLSGEWCVGDQVKCTYDNTYYDEVQNRVEVDMLTIAESDWQPEPNAAYKPVIYLYPEEETEVKVALSLDGELTCTYPKYNGGWSVTAEPDGTLTDTEGKKYNYLYWEGELNTNYGISTGYCVKGEDTALFLEDALSKLGLNRREANEFIVYWLPLMERNEYNLISFDTAKYCESASLEVSPAPETLIRVFMTWKASDVYVELEAEEYSAPERQGFTVVEWGGTELK